MSTTFKDLSDLYERLMLPAEGIAFVERARRDGPDRQIARKGNNSNYVIPSQKIGFTVACESRLEYAFAVQCEYDNDCIEYHPQVALKIDVQTGDRKSSRWTYADFLVLTENKIELIECKPEGQLKKAAADGSDRYSFDDATQRWRSLPGEAASMVYGVGFRVVSDRQINSNYVRNCILLSAYFNEQPLPQKYRARMHEAFASKAEWTLADLSREVGGARIALTAIAHGLIFADLNSALLCKPNHCLVYKDALTASIQREWRAKPFSGLQTSAINAAPGQQLEWDGVRWNVGVVGKSKIFLNRVCERSGDHLSAQLSIGQFRDLVRTQDLRPLPCNKSPVREAIDQRLLQCSPKDMKVAVATYEAIRPALITGKTSAIVGMPPTTARRHVRRWRCAEEQCGYGFIGLLPGLRGNRSLKIPPATTEFVLEFIKEHYLIENAPTKKQVYTLYQASCSERGTPPVSDETFYRIIRQQDKYTVALKRFGRKAALQVQPVHQGLAIIPPHGDAAFQVFHIDHTQLEIALVSSMTERETDRPWLTILKDAYSRLVVGMYLSFDPPSYRSVMMALRDCVRRHNRLPMSIVCDGGKEFESKYFAELRMIFGIDFVRRGSTRAGAPIESAFASLEAQLIHFMYGHTQAMQQPRNVSASHNPHDLAVWTFERLHTHLEEYLFQIYPNLDHQGILDTPLNRFERSVRDTGLPENGFISYDDNFLLITAPRARRETYKISYQRGLHVNHLDYGHPTLRTAELDGTQVAVRYDPFDASHIWAHVRNTWIECRCYSEELRGVSERELRFAIEEINADARRTSRRYRVNTATLAAFFRKIRAEEANLGRPAAQITRQLPFDSEPTPVETPPAWKIERFKGSLRKLDGGI